MECFSKKRTAMIQISICREFQCSILLTAQGRSCPRPPSDGHDWKWPQLWSTRCTTSTAPLTFPPLSQPPRRSVYTKVLLSRCVSDPLCHARPTSTSTSTDVTSLFRAPTLLVKQAKTVDTVRRSLSKQYTLFHNIPRGKLCHFRSGFDGREKRRKHFFGRKTWDLLLSRWIR